MRQPIGYSQKQSGFGNNMMDAMLAIEKVKSLHAEREQAVETEERAKRGEVRTAQQDLQAQQDKTKATKEQIGKDAVTEAFGVNYDQDKSVGPYVEPTLRDFRSGKKTADVINEPGKPGGILLDRPMARPDVVAGLKRGREEFEANVGKAAPTFQDSTVDSTGKRAFNDPTTQVAERAKIPGFVGSPQAMGSEVDRQITRSDNASKTRQTQAVEPFAGRSAAATTRTQEANATTAEANVADIPLNRSIKNLDLENAKLLNQIRTIEASTVGERTQLELKNLRQQYSINQQQLSDLQLKAAGEVKFKELWAKGDRRGAALALGSSGAQWLEQDLERRLRVSADHLKATSAYIDDVSNHLKIGKPENIQAANASVIAMNELADGVSRMLDKPTVTVYSIYNSPSWFGAGSDTNVLGMIEVPRQVKDRIDNNQMDWNNPSDLGEYVLIKGAAIRKDVNAMTRFIETEGQKLGSSPATIDLTKKAYLEIANRRFGVTDATSHANPSLRIPNQSGPPILR